MANLVLIRVLADGHRGCTLDVSISGDGSEDLANENLIEGYALTPPCDHFSITRIWHSFEGFEGWLYWGGTTNALIAPLRDDDATWLDYDKAPLTDPQVAGYKGTINLSTIGLGSGDEGKLVLHLKKHGLNVQDVAVAR